MNKTACIGCGSPLKHVFCDLGLTPVSNAFIKPEQVFEGEVFHPLVALVCDNCWLVQLRGSPSSEDHFNNDYVYFSSFSESWLAHARRYVEAMLQRFSLGHNSLVLEIASNDGYLLQYFVSAGVPCLGIEPTANTAKAARLKGVPTRENFFSSAAACKLRDEGQIADLLIGNNVLAHVPDISDFVSGMPHVLKPEGVITLEFPHLLNLIAYNQFDTIYHEHYSYLSLTALQPIFSQARLRIFDIEELPSHGGSLRAFICHSGASHITTSAVSALLTKEKAAGITKLATYTNFFKQVIATKRNLLAYLIDAKNAGRRIAAYGAAAKGNTLLNYCGIGSDFIDFVVDKNPTKQGRLLPGTRIPVRSPDAITETRPDDLLILPWNIRDEIIAQNIGIRAWGGRFIIAIPSLEIIE